MLSRTVFPFLASAACAAVVATSSQAEAQTRRVQLNILVLSAGDVGTTAFAAGLDEGLVPYTVVDLNAANRPLITDAFLSDSTGFNIRRAKFQAVVLPNEAPSQLSAAERDALQRFEREFKIRQLDTYVYPSPAVGLNYPVEPGYAGPLDGMQGSVSDAARASGLGYLSGAVPFENLSDSISETYGYLATARPADPVNQRSFTNFVTMPIPGSQSSGALIGVYADNGREELVITGAFNQYQLQHQLLFPGLLNWLTYGVHFGTERNYLAVHIDDVFLADARWVADRNCTNGDDCPSDVTAPDILMTSADVDALLAFQQRTGIKLDMVFNGFGYDDTIAELGSFPAGARLLQYRSQLRWINHTYTHLNLGCVKNTSVTPWRCATTATGSIIWQPYDVVYNELNRNISFAQQRGISITRGELVTGEHSGLRRAPEEPSDNPNLIRAINSLNIAWAGSDNSRETLVRAAGEARTLPRYPMSIYYNVGTRAEEVDEYNWIYTSRANGGSGLCEDNPLSTCIAPLDTNTGFESYIVPLEARATLMHLLSNSPKPHYAHQSNLAEDRILYPVLDKALADYRSLLSPLPVINPTMTQSGGELVKQTQWKSDRARITAYVQDGRLFVSNNAGLLSIISVPLTLPASSSGGNLTSYGPQRTGWDDVWGLLGANYSLPTSVGYPR